MWYRPLVGSVALSAPARAPATVRTVPGKAALPGAPATPGLAATDFVEPPERVTERSAALPAYGATSSPRPRLEGLAPVGPCTEATLLFVTCLALMTTARLLVMVPPAEPVGWVIEGLLHATVSTTGEGS